MDSTDGGAFECNLQYNINEEECRKCKSQQYTPFIIVTSFLLLISVLISVFGFTKENYATLDDIRKLMSLDNGRNSTDHDVMPS